MARLDTRYTYSDVNLGGMYIDAAVTSLVMGCYECNHLFMYHDDHNCKKCDCVLSINDLMKNKSAKEKREEIESRRLERKTRPGALYDFT